MTGLTDPSPLKLKHINAVIEREGGDKYTNDLSDSGGPTRWGITERTARRYGYVGDMRDLPYETAFRIYDLMYWQPLKLDQIEKLSEPIAEELIDTGVNLGIHQAGLFLQRCLNALNNRGEHYPDIAEDGRPGSRTLAAFSAFLDKRGIQGEVVMMRMLNSLQGAFYVQLAQRREKDEKYIFGWFLNRVV